jgi:hypothetical protein
MSTLRESIAMWAGIISSLLTVIGIVQSLPWLAGISVLFVAASIFAGLYARRERRILNAASVKIEGRSIDSLNLANLRRRVNRSLTVQDVNRQATIHGQDLLIVATYFGFCHAKRETAIDFSIDSDNPAPFDQLECRAYDLVSDPERQHPIRPILRGTDGSSKKITVPLLHPVTAHEPFSVQLECTLPGCMKAGLEYYTAGLSFEQDEIPRATVRLIFVHDFPDWVRVYEVTPSGTERLLRDLPSRHGDGDSREYVDVAESVPGRSTRVYAFRRPTISTAHHPNEPASALTKF